MKKASNVIMFLACRSGYSTYGPTLLISLGVNCFELHWFFTRTCHHVLTSKSSKLMFPTVSHCFPLFPTVSLSFVCLKLVQKLHSIHCFIVTFPQHCPKMAVICTKIRKTSRFHGFSMVFHPSPHSNHHFGAPPKKKPGPLLVGLAAPSERL